MPKANPWRPLSAAALAVLALAACAVAPPGVTHHRPVARADPPSIERGRFLAHGPAHCASCHADDNAAPGAVAVLSGGRRFEIGGLGGFIAKNLTSDTTTGLGTWTDAQIFRVLRTGRTRDGRPLAPMMDTTGMTDDDLLAIVSYLRTLPPVSRPAPPSEVSLVGQVALRWLVGTPKHDALATSDVQELQGKALGAYLADRVANCRGCHTPRHALTGRLKDAPYTGGLELREANGSFLVPNITRSGALRARSEREFVALFRERAQSPGASPMPWTAFARMSDGELAAIYQYLASVPVDGPHGGS